MTAILMLDNLMVILDDFMGFSCISSLHHVNQGNGNLPKMLHFVCEEALLVLGLQLDGHLVIAGLKLLGLKLNPLKKAGSNSFDLELSRLGNCSIVKGVRRSLNSLT